MKKQHISIIGAGTAGLALARILAHQQHEITIIEKASEMENVGAGILLQPAGLAVFEHLGVLGEALKLGCRVNGLEGQLANGHLLVNSHYCEVAPHCFGLGMHRASLCHVLMQNLQHASHDSQMIHWHMGTEISEIVPSGQRMQLIGQTSNQHAFHKLLMRSSSLMARLASCDQSNGSNWTSLIHGVLHGALCLLVLR